MSSLKKTLQHRVPYAVSVWFSQREFSAFQKFIKSRRKTDSEGIPRIKEILKSVIMSAMIADGFWQEAK